MKRCFFTGVILTLALLAPLACAARQSPDALTIIRKSDANLRPHTEKAKFRMTLFAPDGSVEQVRTFIAYYKQQHGVKRTLQKFLSPPILAGTGLLIVDRGGPDQDIWLYLPTTRRIRRIAGRDKSDRYMGTEFAYEDFEGYQIPSYRFTLAGVKTDGKGRLCRIIDAVAATKAAKEATGYSRKRYWIEEKTFYPERIEYYGKSGVLEKVLTAHSLREVDHYWRPRWEEMKNMLSGRITRLDFETDKVNLPLEDMYVSKRFLRSD